MNTSRRRGSPTKCYLLPALYIHAEASNFSRRQSEYRRASNANAPLAASQGNQEDVRFNTSPYASQILTVAALSAACFGLYPTVTFPPIIVTAPRIGGGTVVCRGEACAGVLQSLQETGGSKGGDQSDHENPTEDIPVNPAALCANLNANKPSNCILSNPPPSPGITVPGRPPYQTNGCGTGKIANLFLDLALTISTKPYYSGDFQSPYPGISFRAACDGHNQCWGSGGDKNVCDFNFRSEMISACGGESASNNNCLGFSGLYHGAVSNTGAALSTYNSVQQDRSCALWASDMRENGCSN